MAEQLEPLHHQLDAADIPIADLFLDPNNPRFVGLSSEFVLDDDITESTHQQTALNILETKFGIDKIRMNMEVNGYLPIDRVVVRPFGDGTKYVVLEGNRRIAAAKTLSSHRQDGQPLDDRVVSSVKIIPCLVYSGTDDNAAWLFQGIRHITGISDWSAYNKARLLVEQMEKEGLTFTAAGRRFGLSAFGAGQWVRSYHAFRQAREETDYVSEVDERAYPYIQEVFGRSSIHFKDWLSWDESQGKFKNVDRYNELIGWLYPRGSEDDPEGDIGTKGMWENKRLGNRNDIRQLSYLVQRSPKNFELFRGGLDLEAAYGQAMVEEYEKKKEGDFDAAESVFQAIALATQSLNNIPLIMIRDTSLRDKLGSDLEMLEQAIKFVKE
jgi:hypothetical protein